MREKADIAAQRATAVKVLSAQRDEFVRGWLQKVRLLTREKEADTVAIEAAIRHEAPQLIDMLLSHLEAGPGGDLSSFYHLVANARQQGIRLADLSYLVLEVKSVGKQILFESIADELEAFRVSRLLDDAVEGVLRRSADLYELTSEADQKTADERLQEIFAAWDLDRATAGAETTVEVCSIAAGMLAGIWDLLGVRFHLSMEGETGERDVKQGPDLPVPMVSDETQPGQAATVLDFVPHHGEVWISEDVSHDVRLLNAAELAQAGVGSVACCPLAWRDTPTGVVLLYGALPQTLSGLDGRRLNDLRSVLALAIERAWRLERSHREMTEAEVIARIGHALLERPSRGELLLSMVQALRDFRDYCAVSLFRVLAEDDACVLAAQAGRGGPVLPDDYEASEAQAAIAEALRTQQTVRRDGALAAAWPALEGMGIRAELAVPVTKGEMVLGVVHILSDHDNDFPDSDVAALEHVAPHIGVALLSATMMREREHNLYEIEQAHRHLLNIVRSTAVGITSTDTEGVYTHWSPSCEAMLGYREDEVVGLRTPADFAAEPYDLSAVLDECYRLGESSAERTMLRKDGRARIIRETRVPLENEDGTHAGFTAYLVDVTDQKRAEDELRRERDTLALMVGAMGAGLALFDRQFRLQWANSTLMEWFGFGPEAFGKDCHDIYLCSHARTDTCPVTLVLQTGQPQVRVYENVDKSGVWHCYQQVFTPIRYRDASLIVLTLDITEQRRQTEHLRLINKLAEKVETSLDPERVLHLALTCVTAGHAVGLNRAFIFLLDDSRTYLVGRMAVGPLSQQEAQRIWQDLGRREQTIEQLLDSATPSPGDQQLTELVNTLRLPLSQSRDTLVATLNSRTSAHVGDARTDRDISSELVETLDLEEFVCVPLSVQNEPLGLLLADNRFSRTPIRQYQVELLEMFSRQASLAIANALAYERMRSQLAELERTRDRLIEAERMASVGRMASHLAHEIRNPLTAIGGFAGAIARQHKDDPKTRRNSMIIYEEIRRLERTLANVLDYTRPLRPNRVPMDVNEVVEETVEQFDSELRERNVVVRTTLADAVPEIRADPGMIKQVIINLVRNAIEAMEKAGGGELTIGTDLVEDEVRITVADTGAGMEPETVDSLFSPFFTTKVGGIGLGLSISQRIARQHGGRIESQSKLGSGSVFVVFLPAGRAGETGRPAPAGEARTQDARE